MPSRKFVTLRLLLCSLLLACAAGCDMLPGGSNSDTTPPPVATQSTDRLRDRVASLQKGVEKADAEAKRLREVADKMEKQTHDSGKNVTEAEAPNTFKAVQEAALAESKVNSLKEELETARIDLQKAENQPATQPAGSSADAMKSGLSTSAYIALLLPSLLPLAGVGFLFLYLRSRFKGISDDIWQSKPKPLAANPQSAWATVSDQSAPRQETATQPKQQVAQPAASVAGSVSATYQPTTTQPIDYNPAAAYQHFEQSSPTSLETPQPIITRRSYEVEFPIANADYIERIKNFRKARYEITRGLFIEDNAEDGIFYVVYDGRLPDGQAYFVPVTSRFSTKQEYETRYEKYYDCAKSTGGTIVIIKPAIAEAVTDGWRFLHKGEMKIG